MRIILLTTFLLTLASPLWAETRLKVGLTERRELGDVIRTEYATLRTQAMGISLTADAAISEAEKEQRYGITLAGQGLMFSWVGGTQAPKGLRDRMILTLTREVGGGDLRMMFSQEERLKAGQGQMTRWNLEYETSW